MSEQTFGPRRCRDSKKLPLNQCVHTHFYQCQSCGAVYQKTGIILQEKKLSCCGAEIIRLSGISLHEAQALYPQAVLNYQITGGYNDNAVKVFWNENDPLVHPVWIYLKTFTGGYMKFLHPGKRAPLVFALADTDAFSYCDADPCLECTFRCKRGFELYAYLPAAGMIRLSVDKMLPYWESS